MPDNDREQTLVLIKPDALKHSLTGYILSQLSEFHTGLHFAAMKVVQVSQMLAEEHYAEHRGKVFYPALLDYIRGLLHYPDAPGKHRVIALVYQGPNAVERIRSIAGPTNPHVARDTKPGCIRALGTVAPIKDSTGRVVAERMDNLIHASANAADAQREIKLWFKPNDLPPSMQLYPVAVSEEAFYIKDQQLLTAHAPGSIGFVAPGKALWQSDLEALRLISRGQPAPCSLQSVVAKYLINEKRA